MRRLVALMLLAGSAVPAFAKEKPVSTQMFTVAQFEQALAAAHDTPDKTLAQQIANTRLTERVSDTTLALLQAELPVSDERARLMLLAVADESAFLHLPAAEVLSIPPPDHATQVALINRAMDYVLKTIPTLPDFFATRTTTRFSGTPLVISDGLHTALFPDLEGDQRLTGVGATSATVRYSNGLEVFTDPKKGVKTECHTAIGVAGGSSGEFGEVLSRVAYEVTQGRVVWSHWEQGAAGSLAVFHYQANVVYKFPHRCPHEIHVPTVPVDFRGEIAVDPANGSILRVTEMDQVRSFLAPGMDTVNTMVEYGAVQIGGQMYICPLRSVFLSIGPAFVGTRYDFDSLDKSYSLSEDPVREAVNDMTFTDYHIFRAKARIVAGGASVPDEPSSPSNSAAPSSTGPAPVPQQSIAPR